MTVSVILFCLGLLGVIVRRNLLVIYMGAGTDAQCGQSGPGGIFAGSTTT